MYNENKFTKHKEIWEDVRAIINKECKELYTLDESSWHKGRNAVIHSFLSPSEFLKKNKNNNKKKTPYILPTITGIPLLVEFIMKILVWRTYMAQLIQSEVC